jgi:Arc/MetJ family transcription regulator
MEETRMTRTLVDIDDDALQAAAAELGTTTKVETVNRALAEIAARPRRLEFLETLRAADDDLADPEVMRGAWR